MDNKLKYVLVTVDDRIIYVMFLIQNQTVSCFQLFSIF